MSKILDKLVKRISELPSIGNRSAKRIALYLIKHKNNSMAPLISELENAMQRLLHCEQCGFISEEEHCDICLNKSRNQFQICVVANIGDVWAIERSGSYNGLYHVLHGTLSAIDGLMPEDLNILRLLERIKQCDHIEISDKQLLINYSSDEKQYLTPHNLSIQTNYYKEERFAANGQQTHDKKTEHKAEVILAFPSTLDGQATANYIVDEIHECINFYVKISTLAKGMPLGGELEYMDDATIHTAVSCRNTLN
jgi:recombination protein RecR